MAQVQEFETQLRVYEEKLREAYGLKGKPRHFKRPPERPFTAAERPHTTILFGGLTLAHEHLVKGALKGLGYKIEYLPTPDNNSLSVGKEYGNRGQCNPTYYTVGNLVKYLVELRAQGVEDIENKYVFITAGSCGPCRFGMYEAEYRKALRDAGFRSFRVLLFQQSGGLSQSSGEAGLKMDGRFFAALLKAMMVGDLLNDLGYKIRPYEINVGDTDRVLAQAREFMFETFKNHRPVYRALLKVRCMFNSIPVDYTRLKPKVKVIGEFWAQTTEGDGNYRLGRWLEEEGAEVIVESIGTWIEYLIWSGMQYVRDRSKVSGDPRGLGEKKPRSVLMQLWLGKLLFDAHYWLYRAALGFKPNALPNMKRLAQYARDYYNTRLSGGEGHLEVAKHVMAVAHKKAHMVISVKPFGCMPSTQSDGVQSKVISDYKDSIFIPIETSGDGEVNVKSRVQMKLYEAKLKAREEFRRVLEAARLSPEEVREWVAGRPWLGRAMIRIPHHAASTAADYVRYISLWMAVLRPWRFLRSVISRPRMVGERV